MPVKELTTKRDAKSAFDSFIPSQMLSLKLCSKPSWITELDSRRRWGIKKEYRNQQKMCARSRDVACHEHLSPRDAHVHGFNNAFPMPDTW